MRLTRWQIILGWITAGGLAVSLMMTSRALRQTRESLNLSHLVAREELRAYLAVERFEGIKRLPGGGIRFSYKFINNGLTPATNVVMGGCLNFIDNRPSGFPLEDLPIGKTSITFDIPPGAKRGYFLAVPGAATDLIRTAETGAGCVVVRLTITYTDCFGRHHELDYSEMRYEVDFDHSHLNRAEEANTSPRDC